MIKSGSTPRLPAIGQKIQSLVRLKWLLSLVIAVVVTVAATPPPDQQSPDEQYIHIMAIIDRGDALRAAGQMDAAKAKYKDAQRALLYFKATNPLFAPKTVTYRLNELNTRLETRPPVIEPAASATKPKPKLEAESGASKMEVKLIDAGAEPRKVLRFHVTPGDKQTAIMTIKTSNEMSGATAPGAAAPAAPMKIPTITIPLDFSILNIETNGDVTYETVIGEAMVAEDPAAPPQMVQGMKAATGGLKGLTITSIVSSRGLSKKVEAKGPPAADPMLRQVFEGIKEAVSSPSILLPEEAIGGGAKWEVKMPVKSQGVTIDRTMEFQLVSVDGDHLKGTFTLDESAPNTKAQNSGVMANATGTVEADLSKLVASDITVNHHIETPPTKEQPAGMKMDRTATIEAK